MVSRCSGNSFRSGWWRSIRLYRQLRRRPCRPPLSGSKRAVFLLGARRVHFGCSGPESFPIDPFITQLRAGDIAGDGLIDLVVANNSRSKITLLYNQTGKTNLPAARRLVLPVWL